MGYDLCFYLLFIISCLVVEFSWLLLTINTLCLFLFIYITGSLPGIQTVEPTDADVKEAVAAMDIQDDGSSKLNYFIQAYRAGDFPFYADYAVHRASEPLAGPRQIVVTK